MGLDIIARNKKTDFDGYFRSTWSYMSFLRTVMLHADVPEQVMYHPAFNANDGLYVKSQDARLIADRLLSWLKKSTLMLIIDSKYDDPNSIFIHLESKWSPRDSLITEERTIGKKRKIYHVYVTRTGRKWVKHFANFCATSKGFWVY